MQHNRMLLTVAFLSFCGHALAADSPEIRPGVWTARQPETLPLPTQGYEVYLVGEAHGLQENEEFQLRYLEQLHRVSGLRDIAMEVSGVYENDAQAFVDGRSDALPRALCRRVGILEGIRKFNKGLKDDARIRVHFTDIDSPASAIRLRLAALQQRLRANGVRVPDESAIKDHGLETVAQLKRLNPDAATRSELRTVEFSILSLQQGLEVDVDRAKGSPYLDSREEAVASNIVDLIRVRRTPSLLVVYGGDHVSRSPRENYGGPHRDQLFTPMALRLERAGIKAFSVLTLPLAGRLRWREGEMELPWTAIDAHLASGETLDKVIPAASEIRWLYVDSKRERMHLPTDDFNKIAVDALLLFRSGTPIKDACKIR